MIPTRTQALPGTNLYFPAADLLFLHLPRTGGRWRLAALQPHAELRGRWHASYRELGIPAANVVVFLRDPATWIGSIWDFLHTNHARDWAVNHDTRLGPIAASWDADLPTFVERLLTHRPDCLDTYYTQMTAAAPPVTIARTEHSLHDLTQILTTHGIKIPNELPHLSTPMPRPDRPQLPSRLKETIRAANPLVCKLWEEVETPAPS